jgi:hypothetical protein
MKYRKGTIKALIHETVSAMLEGKPDATVSLYAHELWRDGEGWTSNDLWRMTRECDAEQAAEHGAARWEVFKANYASKARVSDVRDIGWDSDASLECDCLPFLDIRIDA